MTYRINISQTEERWKYLDNCRVKFVICAHVQPRDGHDQKGPVVGTPATAYLLWHTAVYRLHCIRFIFDIARPSRKPGMEQPVLGDTAVCLRQHRGEKFSAGKPGRMLYFFSIVSPVEFVLAKLVFNAVLMLLASLVSLTLFSFSTTRFLIVANSLA